MESKILNSEPIQFSNSKGTEEGEPSQIKLINPNTNRDLKIVVIGNSGAGKTSFVTRWIKNVFEEAYKPTVMSDFQYKVFEYQKNYYKVQLWDICGQDRNIQLTKIFARNAHGCIVVSDITNPQSLEISENWKKELDKNCSFLNTESKIPSIFIQNKIDLLKNPILNEEEIKQYVEKGGYVNSFNVSAKTGEGIDDAMAYLIHVIVDKYEEYIQKFGGNIIDNRKSIVVEPKKISRISLLPQKNCPC